jgi:hypothetical protein
MIKNKSDACEKARRIIRESGGVIKTSEAIQAGIHSRTPGRDSNS